MTSQQQNFIGELQSNQHNNIKPHRQCWFMPAWMRDGYQSEVHYYHDRASPLEKFAAMNDKDHPNHDLAVAAEEMKL